MWPLLWRSDWLSLVSFDNQDAVWKSSCEISQGKSMPSNTEEIHIVWFITSYSRETQSKVNFKDTPRINMGFQQLIRLYQVYKSKKELHSVSEAELVLEFERNEPKCDLAHLAVGPSAWSPAFPSPGTMMSWDEEPFYSAVVYFSHNDPRRGNQRGETAESGIFIPAKSDHKDVVFRLLFVPLRLSFSLGPLFGWFSERRVKRKKSGDQFP